MGGQGLESDAEDSKESTISLEASDSMNTDPQESNKTFTVWTDETQENIGGVYQM